MRRVTFCHKTEQPNASSSSSSRLVVLYGVYLRTQRGASDRFVETRGVSSISLLGPWNGQPPVAPVRTGHSELLFFSGGHPRPDCTGIWLVSSSWAVNIHPRTCDSFFVRGLSLATARGSRGKGEVRAHCCCCVSSCFLPPSVTTEA